jgi:glutamate racemase
VSNSHDLQSNPPEHNRRTIGVFDSGVGGLTVLRALIEHIPGASYLYFGDTARLPYGSKSAATVAHYAVDAVRYLQDQGAELLVIACNTATALALEEIKRAARVPVIGVIEPGADAAALASKKKHAVVIGTEATVASHAYRKALETRKVRVREKACPLFVPLVEEGWIEHPVTEQVAKIYLAEAFASDVGSPETRSSEVHSGNESASDASADDASAADVLLLGCTHYPLIKPLLRRVAPAHITIVDSAESTAEEVARQLKLQPVPRSDNRDQVAAPPELKFFATDSAEKFRKMGTRFLGLPVENVVHVDLKE